MVIKTTYNLDKKKFKSISAINNKIKSTKTNFVANNSISSICNKFGKHKPTNETISPYLNSAKIQMLSQMTARKFVQKKTMDLSLSFSQANKIYKANSGELRSIKGKIKKNKLSSSTVSNELSKIQQTVSDMNDSDYRNRVDTNRKSKRKRRPSNKYSRPYYNCSNYEFYNGDLLLYPASKSEKKHLNENKKNDFKKLKVKRNLKNRDHVQPSDVWAMLRNMNRFQHISSPPLSEDSNETIKKKGSFIKCPNKAGLIETTEEFSFISSYDIKNKSQSDFSQPSSFDRITIIEKKEDLDLQELIKRSISKTLSSQLLHKKSKNKRKYQIENKELQNLTSTTDFEMCKTENLTKDCLSDNASNCFNKSASKQCLNEFSNCNTDKQFVLESNGQLGNDLKSKHQNRCTKKNIVHNKCDTNSNTTEVPDSENQLSAESDISSKEGLKGLYAIKLTNKSKTMAEKTPEANVNNNNKGFLKHIEIQKKNQSLFSEKLRVTEIRRQLLKLKFPIVILTKDEVSSAFQVIDYDPPQFNGLNRTIWPFMVEWSQNLKSTKSFKNRVKNLGSTKYLPKLEANVLTNNDDINETSKNSVNQSGDVNNQIKPPKPKVLGQFKNKIMDLIYNKSQKNMANQNNMKVSTNQVLNKNTNVLKYKKSNADTTISEEIPEKNIKKRCNENLIAPQKSQPAYKTIHPWSKAKWASDFIDNIINKMKKGAYYTQDSDVCEEKITADTVPPIEPENITNKLIPKDTDYACIPGFDHSQDFKTLKLEVKMITRTQISIHHCLTNVVLQFDVTVPLGADSTLSSSLSSSLPATTNGHMSTLYRCKTRIPNAVLPGELCSILPKLLNEIMNGNKTNLIIPDSTSMRTSGTNQLEPIKDANSTTQSQEIKRLMNGVFCNAKSLKLVGKNTSGRMLLNSDLYHIENRHLSVNQLLGFVDCIYKCICVKNISLSQTHVSQHRTQVTPEKPLKQCMALVLYTPPKPVSNLELKISMSTYNVPLTNSDLQKLALSDFSTRLYQWKTVMDNYYNTNIINIPRIVKPSYPIDLSISIKRQNSIEYMQRCNQITESPSKAVKCVKIIKNSVKKSSRKSYKKSKANGIKSNGCTSLNKITNLDEFFNVLGWCKKLSNVLQGYSEKNILSSIIEMKNWIKEITQAQALLVLLLANKKETVNLKRFRPMLLQGIAVNRITTAEELDMELEVIEKENLCISQNEGISFLSGCNDNLLDELCWIAKTTASDYQKPFDESSKKLLKSLLGKRKKLNPSYLRVMARYVGLGLLKQRGT